MSQSFRHPEILEIARRDGKVTVEELAQHFGVTLQTIRRDLSDLAEGGQLGSDGLPEELVALVFDCDEDIALLH